MRLPRNDKSFLAMTIRKNSFAMTEKVYRIPYSV